MNLLVDASFHAGFHVGIARYIERLVSELCRLCRVTVLTSCPEVFSGLNCRTIVIPRWTRTHRGRIFWELTKLRHYCTSEYDLLLCPTPIAPPLCSLPVISILHDLTPLTQHQHHSTPYKTAFWLSLQTLRWSQLIITDSCHTKKDILARNLVKENKVHVVYIGPGIEPTDVDCGFAANYRPYILYVGGHIPTKNVPRLVTAFAKFSRNSEFKLLLVGWGHPSHIDRTKRAISRYRLEKKVLLLNSLTDAQLSSLYTNCSFFVFPSLYEGFGLPVLEALAHGAPVACSFSASLPEIAGAAALYFNPINVNDIARTLEIMAADPVLLKTLSQRGMERAKLFSWKRAAQQIYNLAENLARF